MRFIKNFLLAVLIVLIIVVVVGLFLPSSYTVERSITIDADTQQVHEYVGDLEKWDDWTPWKEEDPSIVVTRGDKTSGVGASQYWVGDSGDGALTIIKDSPEEGIEYELMFEGGKYVSQSEMKYEELQDGKTKVIWVMKGDLESPVIGGYFALLMDSMVGEMFDKGLKNLKTKVEQGS